MKKRTWKIIAVIVMILFVTVKKNSIVLAAGNGPEVHFLNTGQSDCTFIKSESMNMLVDTGDHESSGNVVSYLRSLGVSKIDHIIITHYHDDHYGGMMNILDNFKVDNVLLPNHKNDMSSTILIKDLLNKGVRVKYLKDSWICDKKLDVCLNVICPSSYDEDIENNNSVVINGMIDGITYLFAADVESKAEKELVKRGVLDKCMILKVPHHGLDTSSSEIFIDKVKPEICVITCNGKESPDANVLRKLSKSCTKVLRTDELGTIVVKDNVIYSMKDGLNDIVVEKIK